MTRTRNPAALAAPTAPAQTQAPGATPKGKLGLLAQHLRAPEGATLEALMAATGWQAHSVRGAISGALKKKLGLAITSDKTDGVRRYRIAAAPAQ